MEWNFTTYAAKLPVHHSKNRYVNIIPCKITIDLICWYITDIDRIIDIDPITGIDRIIGTDRDVDIDHIWLYHWYWS